MKDADIISKFCNVNKNPLEGFGKEGTSSAHSELNTAASDTRIDILGGNNVLA